MYKLSHMKGVLIIICVLAFCIVIVYFEHLRRYELLAESIEEIETSIVNLGSGLEQIESTVDNQISSIDLINTELAEIEARKEALKRLNE